MHFPPGHKFSALFNRNTIKVSYSCMPNIKAEIHKHNINTLEKAQRKHPDTQLCNCTNKKQCPLNRQCLTESIVYQANITANIPGYKEKVYLGVSETTFNPIQDWHFRGCSRMGVAKRSPSLKSVSDILQ